MSAWGDIIDKIFTHIRTAEPDITAANQEREIRLGVELTTEEFPHVFAHSIAEARNEEEWQQDIVAVDIIFDVWTDHESQEEVSVRLDNILAQLKTDRTLADTVDKLRVIERSISEFPGKTQRVGRLIVEIEETL